MNDPVAMTETLVLVDAIETKSELCPGAHLGMLTRFLVSTAHSTSRGASLCSRLRGWRGKEYGARVGSRSR